MGAFVSSKCNVALVCRLHLRLVLAIAAVAPSVLRRDSSLQWLLYPSSGGARSGTWNPLSTPLATDLWPGPEAAVEECSAGLGIRFLPLSPPTLGRTRMG